MRTSIILLAILVSAFIIRIYRLPELMPFIGDQAWFYLSARDLLLGKDFPLVGITSSHTWLHQGPLWTYMLAILFALFDFHPLVPGYFSALFGVVTVFVAYKVSTSFFSEKIGLVTAFLFAFSPLVIIHTRMPYHILPIPLLILTFMLVTKKWIDGQKKYLPLIFLHLSLLYNFELASQVLWTIFFVLLAYGFWKKTMYIQPLYDKKIIVWSIIALLFPMLPVLVYDVTHGFPQTVKFAGWIVYSCIKFLLPNNSSPTSFFDMTAFFEVYTARIFFLDNILIALSLLGISMGWFLWKTGIKMQKKQLTTSWSILFLFTVIPILGIVVSKTPSEAYLPLVYPGLLMITGVMLGSFHGKIFFMISSFILLLYGIGNTYSLITKDYLMGKYSGYGPYFSEKINVSKQITMQIPNNTYTLVGKGEGSEFASFTMPYEYLIWWVSKKERENKSNNIFVIEEEKGKVQVHKR